MAVKLESTKNKRGSASNIARLLKQEIILKRLPADAPVSSVRKLADKHEVSPVTASKALELLAKDNIIYRKKGIGTFVAEQLNWKSSINKRIGLGFIDMQARYLSESHYSAFGLFHSKIIDLLNHKGHEALMISYNWKNNPRRFKNSIDKTDALIINKDMIKENNFEILLSYPNPVVLIDCPFVKDLPFHQVAPDYFFGYRKVIQYLEKAGCKTVACAGISDTETHNFRVSYFSEIFSKSSTKMIKWDNVAIPFIEHDMGRLAGREIGKMFLAQKRLPDAIFSVSDFVSFGILDVFFEKNMVPGIDFKLISFDNIESKDLCPFGKPILTSLNYPRKLEAEQVIKLLDFTMNSNDEILQSIRIPVKDLVVRTTA